MTRWIKYLFISLAFIFAWAWAACTLMWVTTGHPTASFWAGFSAAWSLGCGFNFAMLWAIEMELDRDIKQ